jgi:hypothetical protein
VLKLDNGSANLKLMPMRINPKTHDKPGDRQRVMAGECYPTGGLSKPGLEVAIR